MPWTKGTDVGAGAGAGAGTPSVPGAGTGTCADGTSETDVCTKSGAGAGAGASAGNDIGGFMSANVGTAFGASARSRGNGAAPDDQKILTLSGHLSCTPSPAEHTGISRLKE